jgi:TolB-like protein
MFGRAPAPVIAVHSAGASAERFVADVLCGRSHEDLISRLGQTPGLKYWDGRQPAGYRNRQPRDVAQELGAGVVLTGSVRPSADNVKISLELINPLDGTAIWSSQYTRDVQDIFKVQEQIAEEVATALSVKLQPSAASARTASRLVDPKAYEQYLRARQAMDGRRIADAISLYRSAITADAVWLKRMPAWRRRSISTCS